VRFSRLIQVLLGAVIASAAAAQEMEPRAYSPAPIGTQFVLLTYGHQSGDVLLDASIPLKDVNVRFNAGSVAYGRTFDLAAAKRTLLFCTLISGERLKEPSSKIKSR